MSVTDRRLDNLKPSECRRVGEVLARVGDKWTMQVIAELGEGSRRFSELRRAIAGVSQRMLTLTLKNLERDGLVSRTVTPSVPPRVDYALTDLGRSMLLPVQALGEWAAAHIPAMDAARSRYDGREAG
jgi:DNA-binding HxlR family transcriptional regulator